MPCGFACLMSSYRTSQILLRDWNTRSFHINVRTWNPELCVIKNECAGLWHILFCLSCCLLLPFKCQHCSHTMQKQINENIMILLFILFFPKSMADSSIFYYQLCTSATKNTSDTYTTKNIGSVVVFLLIKKKPVLVYLCLSSCCLSIISFFFSYKQI